MPEFVFDPENHSYSLDGVELPSVTTILKAEGFMGSFDYSTDWHMDRGSHVHKTVELYLKGSLDEETLDPILRPYLEGFKAFMTDTGFVVHGYETPMYHTMYKYAGTPDLWGVLGIKKTLLDIKTGTPAAWHRVQLGAYCALLSNHYLTSQAGCLYLSEDGKYNLSKLMATREISEQISFFTCAYITYNWKKENLK